MKEGGIEARCWLGRRNWRTREQHWRQSDASGQGQRRRLVDGGKGQAPPPHWLFKMAGHSESGLVRAY